jgi:hypothetical protein
MAKVYRIRVEADFYVVADDHVDATTIASVLTDGVDEELPFNATSSLHAYEILRQDDYMRRQCVNYEGHAEVVAADSISADASGDKHGT